MESYLLPLKSISDSWMSHSAMFVVMDMTFGILCGVGLFSLLIPLLKDQTSPPRGSKRIIPKVVKRRRQRNIRKGTAAVEGCRHGRKSLEDTENASPPKEIPTKHPLMDSMPHRLRNSNEKLNQHPLSDLLYYWKVFQDLIKQKYRQLFGGKPPVLSESEVATDWLSRTPSSVRFSNAHDPPSAPPETQGPPRLSQPQPQPLPHRPGARSLGDVTEVQELEILPGATPNLTSSSSESSTCGRARPTTETRIQASLPTENQPWQSGVNSKETTDSISQPTDSMPRGTLSTEAIMSASILPEHCQVPRHQEETRDEGKMSKMVERGTANRLLPSNEIGMLQGQRPARSPRQPKNRPDLSQLPQPSILDAERSKLSQMTWPVPSEMPSKKDSSKYHTRDSIKKGPGDGAKDLPSTSRNTPAEDLEPRNSTMRTDLLSYMNTTQNLPFLDPNTRMKLESNVKQLPVKHGRTPCLETLEPRDLTPPWLPASPLPQPVFPSSPTCASKAEHHYKAGVILENLHHQDPGGTKVETLSEGRLQNPLSVHAISKAQTTYGACPPAPSHGPSKACPTVWQRYMNNQTQAKSQQSKSIQGIGRGSLQPSTSPRMPKPGPRNQSENVTSGHPCWRRIVIDHEKSGPSSVAKQTDSSLPRSWNRSSNSKTSHGLNDVFIGRDHRPKTWEYSVPNDKIAEKTPKVFQPYEHREFVSSRAKIQGERLGGVQSSSLNTSSHLKNLATTKSQSSHDMPGKSEALPERILREIENNITTYLILRMKDKEQGDSLKNQSPPPSTVQTQEAVTREELFCTMAHEVQAIMDIVEEALVNRLDFNVEEPLKRQGYNVEPLTSQLGGFSHSSEGQNDTKSSRPTRKNHDPTLGHNNPFLYWRIREKYHLGIDAQKARDPRKTSPA